MEIKQELASGFGIAVGRLPTLSFGADLRGEVALVTGASSGLGQHFATVLARAGAQVVCAARRRDRLDAQVSVLREEGYAASAVTCDVTKTDSVDQALAWIAGEVGCPGILVNNAGVVVSKPLLDHTEADWDQVVDTDLKGAWLMAAGVARRLVSEGRRGRIINIASILGLRPIVRIPSYAAAKAGLLHLTRAMALELAPAGISVNAIAPGYIETDLNRDFLASERGRDLVGRIPFGRVGRPEDLDGALLLLASSAADYMTGTTITVDGGHLVAGV